VRDSVWTSHTWWVIVLAVLVGMLITADEFLFIDGGTTIERISGTGFQTGDMVVIKK
jgi:hypothetical protein